MLRIIAVKGPLLVFGILLILSIPGCKYNIASKAACKAEMISSFNSAIAHVSWNFDGPFPLCHGLSNQEVKPLVLEALKEAMKEGRNG